MLPHFSYIDQTKGCTHLFFFRARGDFQEKLKVSSTRTPWNYISVAHSTPACSAFDKLLYAFNLNIANNKIAMRINVAPVADDTPTVSPNATYPIIYLKISENILEGQRFLKKKIDSSKDLWDNKKNSMDKAYKATSMNFVLGLCFKDSICLSNWYLNVKSMKFLEKYIRSRKIVSKLPRITDFVKTQIFWDSENVSVQGL